MLNDQTNMTFKANWSKYHIISLIETNRLETKPWSTSTMYITCYQISNNKLLYTIDNNKGSGTYSVRYIIDTKSVIQR